MSKLKRTRLSVLLSGFLLVTFINPAQAEEGGNSQPDALRVCSDPNNLPYSNKKGQGFENKIAERLAAYFNLDLEYVWFPQRMGFIRNTLKSWSDENQRYACDLVIGVPTQFDQASTTKPYYRSAYTVLYKQSEALNGVDSWETLAALPNKVKDSLDLASFSPSPTVQWVRDNGFFDNTEFFQIMNGDPEDYPGKMVKRVADGEFDVLFIWGPIAGYFAKQHKNLTVIPMVSKGSMRFDFPISMAVRYGEKQWQNTIQQALDANKKEIDAILADYAVPVVEASSKPLPTDDD